MNSMKELKKAERWKRGAFTLVEMMISAALFGLVTAGSFGVYIMCQKLWRATTLSTDTARTANLAIERMLYGVGTNNGLRAAASIEINTNFHSYPPSSNYWDSPGGVPSPANNWANNLSPNMPDGSWRITYSNTFDGVKYISYVKKNRAIVIGPDEYISDNRLSIANYVVDASASTNTNPMGITIMVRTWKKDGVFIASNQASATITKRN